MPRASFECPVTGEQCSAPNCKRTFCAKEGPQAMREKEQEQEQRTRRLIEIANKGDPNEFLHELGLAPKPPRIKRRF
jgi:hypothetical protein